MAVIVLNWNGRDDSLRCLGSLEVHGGGCDVLFVDNGSTDGSVAAVHERFPTVEIIVNDHNLGFAAGNNRGLERALATTAGIIGVLNNDTVVTEGFLDPIVAAISDDPSAFVSPLIHYLDRPEEVWFGGAEVDPRSGIFVHRPGIRPSAGHVTETPMVTGCALFAHRDAWNRVGLFDEGYFLIFEDADWSARANRLGLHGLVIHDSRIHHAVSATIEARSASAADYYYARNGIRFIRDHVDHPGRAGLRFMADLGRHGVRPMRADASAGNVAVPVLQVKGTLDGLLSRRGPMPTSALTRWGEQARSASDADPAPPSVAVRPVAFYLPQYHPIPENDEWWGAGFTEWTNTAKARKRFPGHYQPHVPADLGFYDLRVPETRVAQAELARAHGIEGFVYWHYWFGGRRILERPFAEVLAAGEPDFGFALGWANQTWSGIWHGAPNRILIEQEYPGEADDRTHFDHLLPAFTDDRYITVDGKPLFYVFRPEQLPEPAAFVERWQIMATEAGLPGLYLVAEMSDLVGAGPIYPDPFGDGFDAGLHVHIPIDTSPTSTFRMRALRKLGLPEIYPYAREPVPRPSSSRARPVLPCVYPNWDNTPRSGSRGLVAHGSTPERFRTHVDDAVRSLASLPEQQRLLFVKSWNEWAEGNHLEPDQRWGHGYLEALAESIGRR